MSIEVISGPGVPSGPLPFSPALKAGDFVFVSGQASVDDAGKIVVDTFEGEFHRSMRNVQKILEAAGLGFQDVVQVRAYVDDPQDLTEYNRLYRDYFGSPPPARTTLVNCLGGVIKFEIDVTAYAGNRPAAAP